MNNFPDVERTGQIYHLIGIYDVVNHFLTREQLDHESFEYTDNIGKYLFEGRRGHFSEVAFNRDATANPDRRSVEEVRLPFGYWRSIGAPNTIEKVVVKVETEAFINPNRSEQGLALLER